MCSSDSRIKDLSCYWIYFWEKLYRKKCSEFGGNVIIILVGEKGAGLKCPNSGWYSTIKSIYWGFLGKISYFMTK